MGATDRLVEATRWLRYAEEDLITAETLLGQQAVEARYPGDWPEATDAEANMAVRQARAVWKSISTELTQREGSP